MNLTKIVGIINDIISSPRVEVISVDNTLFKESLPLYIEYPDLSFTDAASLLIMKKYGLRDIYSHDSGFDKVFWISRRVRP
ncbi:MAG: hypothetical protein ACUVTM_07375 [Candidatus Bathyarchaeia archaeon]